LVNALAATQFVVRLRAKILDALATRDIFDCRRFEFCLCSSRRRIGRNNSWSQPMATDLRLDDGPASSWVTVEAPVLQVEGSDLILDSKPRRGGHNTGIRRALVHGEGDQLILNFNGDYTGGVAIPNARLDSARIDNPVISNARIGIACVNQGASPQLPRSGVRGDLLVTHNEEMSTAGAGATVTLWLCLGKHPLEPLSNDIWWVPISTGDAVKATA
jgi:hypothetical protein